MSTKQSWVTFNSITQCYETKDNTSVAAEIVDNVNCVADVLTICEIRSKQRSEFQSKRTNMKAKLNPILHNLRQSVTEQDKRSDHPDFLTSAELKAKEWSGVRLNSLIDTYEFWISGEVRKTLAASVVRADYMSLERAHVELFGIHSRNA